jgi:hypothetical protein
MAGFLDLKRFYQELETSAKFAVEEKRLYNSLRELNTGGWNNNYQSNTLGPSNSVSSVLGPVLVPDAAAAAVVPASLGPVVIPAAPPSIEEIAAAASNNQRDMIINFIGTNLIKKKSNDNVGSITTGGRMSYRHMDLFLVEGGGLNGVSLEIWHKKDKKHTFTPVTNGLMSLIFTSSDIGDNFVNMWAKVSADDKLNFIKLNKIVVTFGEVNKGGDLFLSMVYQKMDATFQRFFTSYKASFYQKDAAGRSTNVIVEQFRSPLHTIITDADVNRIMSLSINPANEIVGAGIQTKSIRKSKKTTPATIQNPNSDRLTLLLGAINAGNNNKRMIQEALSLLGRDKSMNQ